MLLIAFCSPYWLQSWEDTHSPFLNMGLWEFCFYRFRSLISIYRRTPTQHGTMGVLLLQIQVPYPYTVYERTPTHPSSTWDYGSSASTDSGPLSLIPIYIYGMIPTHTSSIWDYGSSAKSHIYPYFISLKQYLCSLFHGNKFTYKIDHLKKPTMFLFFQTSSDSPFFSAIQSPSIL